MRIFSTSRNAGISGLNERERKRPADAAAFARLMEPHKDRLYRVAYRMTGHSQDAEDLMQDALVEAYRSFGSFQEGTHFDKWLYRIMTNTFIDRQRKRKRVGYVQSLDQGGEDAREVRDVPDSKGDPAVIADMLQYSEAVEQALLSLSPEFRMVLILSDVEECSYEEISEAMGTPIGTVRSRLHRARTMMKAALTARSS